MSDCLHCDIGELLADYIKNSSQPVDLSEIAAMMAQSLGEFILSAPEHTQAALMADCLTVLGTTILDKPDEAERSHRAH